MQALPGFRDLYPEEAARRAAVTSAWRRVARTYGFEEYDGPAIESLDLYAKKNAGGEEILGQLYRFEDGGGRQVALRPEMTPTLARMAAAREKHYAKPMRWFAVGGFFRYERQQRGRLREFLQFNADILGDAGPGADAEIVALAIDTLRAFSLGPQDVVARLSHRGAWSAFLAGRGLSPSQVAAVLPLADKLDREPPETLDPRLAAASGGLVDLDALRTWIAGPPPAELATVLEELDARGLGGFVEADLSIVRGLAYYTGVVFEVFDRSRALRAVAGGGRYDALLEALGGVPLPAVGFAMGDVVLGELIAETPVAREALEAAAAESRACDVCVVVAKEDLRREALRLAQTLRDAGLRVSIPLAPAKVGRQFQAAERAGAAHAVLVGDEWPSVKLKMMATRAEEVLPHEALAARLGNRQPLRSR